MRPARILLLLIAIVAGGLAAFLATRGGPPPTVIQQVAAPLKQTGTQVLIAKAPIGVGQRLSADLVQWQRWPDDAVRPEYITIAKTPDAPTQIAGAVARFEIFEGEPILDAKLVHSDQGYLSAVLDPGMRGVSVNISAASGSGGFIIPNDRVDVLVTDNKDGATVSHVVLSDVKVLAIGTRLGQTGTTGAPKDPSNPSSQVFTSDAIATLELTPGQAQTLINSTATGKISLVLRSVADFGRGTTAQASTASTDDQTIKVIRFGRASNVTPGDTTPPQATVTPTAYTPPATPAAEPTPTTDDSDAATTLPPPPGLPPPTTTVVTTTTPGPVVSDSTADQPKTAPTIQ